MRRTSTLTALLLVLFTLPATAQQGDLQIWLSAGTPTRSSFEVIHLSRRVPVYLETSEPSYVAVFEITPHSDVLLRYPFEIRSERRVSTGLHFLDIDRFGAHWWAPAGIGNGYLIAVASRTPLNLRESLRTVGNVVRWEDKRYFSHRDIEWRTCTPSIK